MDLQNTARCKNIGYLRLVLYVMNVIAFACVSNLGAKVNIVLM